MVAFRRFMTRVVDGSVGKLAVQLETKAPRGQVVYVGCEPARGERKPSQEREIWLFWPTGNVHDCLLI